MEICVTFRQGGFLNDLCCSHMFHNIYNVFLCGPLGCGISVERNNLDLQGFYSKSKHPTNFHR